MISFIIRHPIYFILSLLLHVALIGLFVWQNQIEKPLLNKSIKSSSNNFKAEDALKKKLNSPMKTYTVDSKLVQKQLTKIKLKEELRKKQQKKLKQQNIREAKKLADLKYLQKQEHKKAAEAERERIKLEKQKVKIEKEILRKSLEKEQIEQASIQAKSEQKRLQEEATLQRKLAEDEEKNRIAEKSKHLKNLRSIYIASIASKVRENWRTPVKISSKAECEILITQTPKGHVSSVSVENCNQYATAQFKKAAEDAVYRSDPIPVPPQESLFERNIRFVFKP